MPATTALHACLPAALLLLFGVWAGTFPGAASAGGAAVGHAVLLACLAAAGRRAWDPLRLGRTGGLLLGALALSIFASWWLSPVRRAGVEGLLILPALVVVPAVVERAWAGERARQLGLWMTSVAVAAVAAWALWSAWRLGTRAALPLGHHNLLAAWLVATLPLAAVPWRDRGWGRAAATAAVGLGAAALVSSRSLAAAAGIAVAALVFSRRGRWLLLAAALVALPQLGRLERLLAGDDVSARARWGYLEAGWRGLVERPVFGWGPGSTAWTLAERLRPVPGVHPPGEVVADLHSLPLTLAYELGLGGLVLALGLAAVWTRRRGSEAAGDPGLRRAGLFALTALAVSSLAGLPLAVTALPVAAAVAAGAAQAARDDAGAPSAGPAWPAAALTVLLAALLLPLDLARFAYERAARSGVRCERLAALERAVAGDSKMPLYRARRAWLEAEIDGPHGEPARRALAAAEDAHAVAPLWLAAGLLAQESGEPWSREALVAACRLDPLAAVAPFHLATGEPPEERSVAWAARALLAEPRLLAAPAWDERPRLLTGAVERIVALPGVDAGWRLRLAETARGLERGGPRRRLALAMDGEAATSLSLHAFRRLPWPARLAEIELSAAALEAIDLPPAARLEATRAHVFAAPDCGLPERRPGRLRAASANSLRSDTLRPSSLDPDAQGTELPERRRARRSAPFRIDPLAPR